MRDILRVMKLGDGDDEIGITIGTGAVYRVEMDWSGSEVNVTAYDERDQKLPHGHLAARLTLALIDLGIVP